MSMGRGTGHRRAGALTFAVASPRDEPDIRRVLREVEMGGAYRISLEREPDAFAGSFGVERAHAFVIARDADSGEAVGVCERTVYDCFINGVPRPVPYLGALRIRPSHRHRISIVKGGFDVLRSVECLPDEVSFALTSVAVENTPAIRLLTGGLPGLPRYQPVGLLSTLLLRPRRHGQQPSFVASIGPGEYPELAAFLQRTYAHYQFASVWREQSLRSLQSRGLSSTDILVARKRGAITGAIALWDQRAIRQVVVRGYPPAVAWFRPFLNLLAPFKRLPPFPEAGRPINMAALSHFAVADGDGETFFALVDAVLEMAWQRSYDTVMLGIGTHNPWQGVVAKHYGAVEYLTQLFIAYWPDATREGLALDGRMLHPEAALL